MTTGPIDFARKFHRDRRGQIMPLVFFLGIAFFTGVVLVINTGRTVTGRIQAQNAVDAAAVSGANTIARGMNYISSNNISMAKLLASIVILRAFPGAIDDANTTLDVWEGVATGMISLGAALLSNPFTAAAGAALEAIGHFILDVKIPQERAVLEFIGPVIDGLKSAWDNDGNGLAWFALKALAKLGDVLAYESPILAQFTARTVYGQDIGSGEGGEAFMLPLYPKMPSCKGKFADFLEKTQFYVERYSEPIVIAGWIILTLSLFPLHYQAHLKSELKKLFTGGTTDTTVADPLADEMKRLKQEVDDLRVEVDKQKAKRDRVMAQIASVNAGDDPTVHPELGTNPTDLNNQKLAIEAKIRDLNDQIKVRQDRMQEIADQQAPQSSGGGAGQGTPPDDFSTGLGDVTGGAAVNDNPDVYPYMIDGKDWPKSFTYFCLGTRSIATPMTDRVFKKPMGTAYVYAAARVVNAVEADLWTPAWHARLVRAQANLIPTNPVGSLPSACGEEGGSAGGDVPAGMSGPPDADGEKGVLDKLLGLLSKH